jgi:hypothetical protein
MMVIVTATAPANCVIASRKVAGVWVRRLRSLAER